MVLLMLVSGLSMLLYSGLPARAAGEGETLLETVAAPPKPDHAKVDVTITTNTIEIYHTDGRILPKEVRVTMEEVVEINSGEYRGWAYGRGGYTAGPSRGFLYFVRHFGEVKGLVTGDIQATFFAIGDGDWTCFVDWQQGRPEAGRRVMLSLVQAQEGETTSYQDVLLLICKNVELTAKGSSPQYEQTSTILLLPSADGSPHNMRRWKGVGLEFVGVFGPTLMRALSGCISKTGRERA